MYKRLLVPIDDSETTNSILNEIVQICSENETCTITLLHILKPSVGTAYMIDTNYARKQMEQEGNQILNQAVQYLLSLGIQADRALLWGEPAHEISQYADNEEIDLIVVGNKDKGLLEKLLTSSVSQKVVRDSSSQVLVVK